MMPGDRMMEIQGVPMRAESAWGRRVIVPRSLVAPVAALIAIALLIKGGVQFWGIEGAGFDWLLIWQATRLTIRGIDPFALALDPTTVMLLSERAQAETLVAGIPAMVAYPPLTYVWLSGLGMLDFQYARLGFLVLNLLALAVLTETVWRMLALSWREKWGALALGFANLGFSQTLIGNLGILSIAAMALAVRLSYTHRPVSGGLVLGFSLIKHTVGGALCVALFTQRGQMPMLLVTVGVSIVLWGVGEHLMGVGVGESMTAMMAGVARWSSGGYGLWKILEYGGIARPIAVVMTAVPVLVVMVVMLRSLREPRPLVLLALASVAGRLATYHNQIDNVMLFFLVVALWTADRRPEAENPRMLALATGVTLLFPWRLVDTPFAQACTNAVWVLGAISLWRTERDARFQPRFPTEPLASPDDRELSMPLASRPLNV